jgi:dihydrofolate synthase/folylpolyglutamate synthase
VLFRSAELPRKARYHFCKADIPRGLDAHALREQAAAVGLQGEVHPTVGEALRAARQAAGPEDLVLVTGSVFVVAEAI